MATKKRKVKICEETPEEAVINNAKELKVEKKVIEKKSEVWLQWYSFPKQWVRVMAKDLADAERKMKIIVWYKQKEI